MKKAFVGILVLALILTVSLVGCGSDDDARKVVVGSKPHAEQYVLGEMIAIMLEEHTDIEVERNLGIAGGTSNLHPAMLSGDIDIYPEYTGTGWMFVLKQDRIADPTELFEAVRDQYQEDFAITWLEPLGFNNTFTLAVPRQLAEQYDLVTFSDLAAVSDQLVFGANFDFYERDDGFDALVEAYNFNFKGSREMDIGLRYQSIGAGEIDVVNAFSTDGEINLFDLVILEDDKNFFPSYYAAIIIRNEILDKYPEIGEVLSMLSGQISDAEMTEMNYQVDELNREAADVAREFLVRKGLIESR